MPKRVANLGNKELRRHLEYPYDPVLLRDHAGEFHKRIPILVDAATLLDWCKLVASGLTYFHWGVATLDYEVEAEPLSAGIESHILSLTKSLKGGQSVNESVGDGAFRYRGFRCVDDKVASMWMIELYGAMPIGGDPTVSRICAKSWGVFITPAVSVSAA